MESVAVSQQHQLCYCLGLEGIGVPKRLLKINLSVGVSMYSANVTSYWYFFFCAQRIRRVGWMRSEDMARRKMTPTAA